MVISACGTRLYVGGGRRAANGKVGGVFEYNIETQKWRLLRESWRGVSQSEASKSSPQRLSQASVLLDNLKFQPVLSPEEQSMQQTLNEKHLAPGHIGQSLVFLPELPGSSPLPGAGPFLLLFGGRGSRMTPDVWLYDIGMDEVVLLSGAQHRLHEDHRRLAQHTTGMMVNGQLHVLSTGMHSHPTKWGCKCAHMTGEQAAPVSSSSEVPVFSTLCSFDLTTGRWTTLWKSNSTKALQGLEPHPRVATTFVYSAALGTYFLFGGHPFVAKTGQSNRRHPAKDMWLLRKENNSTNVSDTAVQRALWFVRRQRFLELCAADATKTKFDTALKYLRDDVASTVNHADSTWESEYRALPAQLLTPWTPKLLQEGRARLRQDLRAILNE